MLTFEPYSEETLKRYLPWIERSPYNINDLSAGSFFMWNEGVNLAFAVSHGSFLSRQDICGEPSFSWPFGGEDNLALDELLAYVRERDLPLKFYGVPEALLPIIRADQRFPDLLCQYERKWSDYIYDAGEVSTFRGKKFSGQRNHCNKFRSLYGEPDFRPLTPEMTGEVLRMLGEYAKEHPDQKYEERAEYRHTLELMGCYQDLGMIGGALYVEGSPISVTIGEVQGENLIIHVEKALRRYEGAYPTTFRSFVAQTLLQCPSLRTVNREDDAGDAGLRTSKLQYNPIRLENKYLVKVRSPLAMLKETPILEGDGVILDEIRDTDRENYFRLCTDKENNRLWGYDYETDSSITGDINEDTFYDMVRFDRSLGEGISFAVRERRDGPLIGEAIVYNFTFNGSAEIGARIARDAQGRGYGTKAFRLASDWAAATLGVRLKAKCYLENSASEKMILASGFLPSGEDETFRYFRRSSLG